MRSPRFLSRFKATVSRSITGLKLALILPLCLAALAHSDAQAEGRVIVKYKAGSPLKQALAADRSVSLSSRVGVSVRLGRRLGDRVEALRADGISSDELAARLAREADVEYAVPDQLRTIRALPNDPMFADQWHLQATEAAAIHATDAWLTTTGSANVVVAVIDTGVRYDHPDLAAKLLPGYDFVSDAANAGDGDARDADASDPGDYVSNADTHDASLQAVCGALTTHDSSWHGTRISGILGAATNNAEGIAGTSWGARILPARVLGKCGGFDSDIMAAMLWAGGISVPGVPANANPARILNLSLGGSGSCSAAYSDTVSQLTARGVLVVVAAGNATAVESPGNCPGVLAVAGVRHVGTKVGYSSMGPEVSISAPAGNCVNSIGACLFSILTTTNLGTTLPGTNSYSDQTNYNVGTSFSAPQVAGVAALMLSVNPALQPAEIITRIKQTARAFPSDPTLPACPATVLSGDSQGQCNCTTSTCGAGLLDAGGAVTASLPPIPLIQTLDPLTVGEIRLDSSASAAASGRTLVAWQWSLDSAPAGASLADTNSVVATLHATTAGSYRVTLTVTDNLGSHASTSSILSVADIPAAGGGGGGGGGSIDLLMLAGLLGLTLLARRGG